MLHSDLWEQTDSNRRPSACKADALNRLSYAPEHYDIPHHDSLALDWDCKYRHFLFLGKRLLKKLAQYRHQFLLLGKRKDGHPTTAILYMRIQLCGEMKLSTSLS